MNLPAFEIPSFLLETMPLEPEDIPLQVALLTMELSEQRQRILEMQLTLTLLADASCGGKLRERKPPQRDE